MAVLEGPAAGVAVAAMLPAFAGVWLGARLLKKVTLRTVRNIVAVFLVCIGASLAAGVL